MALFKENHKVTGIYLGDTQAYAVSLKDTHIYPYREKTIEEQENELISVDDVPVAPIEPTAMQQILEYSNEVYEMENRPQIEEVELTQAQQDALDRVARELFGDESNG